MKQQRIYSLKMNNYVRINPQVLLIQGTRWITNGIDNSYFYTVENAYLGSPTNQSIIDNYANYILGEGLEDKNGFGIDSVLDEEDMRLAVTDFKLQGACAFQVVYNLGKKVSRLYYLPTKSLAIAKQPDITEEPKAYYYSFDWKLKQRYRPELIPAYGCGDGLQSEILYIKRHSQQPLYPLPDWQSGIQYCQTEEELSNYYIKHITNNFSAGKIININQGIPDSEEAQEEAERAIKTQLTGSNGAGETIISFNENKENATTVDSIEVTDAYSQFTFLSTECRTMIMMAHKVNDPSLFGLPLPTGFNSAAEQMVQSLKILYRSQINPIRRILTKGLEPIFKTIDPTIELQFKDFEELTIQNQVQNPVTMIDKVPSGEKVGFDFDGTANTDTGKEYVRRNINAGIPVYIVSARGQRTDLLKFAQDFNIQPSRVYAMGSNSSKIAKIKELGLTRFYDNNQDVIDQLPNVGVNIKNV